jgi:hypothetical protein
LASAIALLTAANSESRPAISFYLPFSSFATE